MRNWTYTSFVKNDFDPLNLGQETLLKVEWKKEKKLKLTLKLPLRLFPNSDSKGRVRGFCVIFLKGHRHTNWRQYWRKKKNQCCIWLSVHPVAFLKIFVRISRDMLRINVFLMFHGMLNWWKPKGILGLLVKSEIFVPKFGFFVYKSTVFTTNLMIYPTFYTLIQNYSEPKRIMEQTIYAIYFHLKGNQNPKNVVLILLQLTILTPTDLKSTIFLRSALLFCLRARTYYDSNFRMIFFLKIKRFYSLCFRPFKILVFAFYFSTLKFLINVQQVYLIVRSFSIHHTLIKNKSLLIFNIFHFQHVY